METIKLPTTKDIKQIKAGENDAIIIDLVQTTWKELTKDLSKKPNASEEPVLKVIYQVHGLTRNEVFGLPEVLTNFTKYGRFLNKYDTANNSDFQPFVGMKIKVDIDSSGKSTIVLD